MVVSVQNGNDPKSVYHIVFLARGHHQCIPDYDNQVDDWAWRISTQHSIKSSRYSTIYQELLRGDDSNNSERAGDDFPIPANYFLFHFLPYGEFFPLQHETNVNHADSNTVAYKHKNLVIHVRSDPLSIKYTLMADDNCACMLDSVRGMLEATTKQVRICHSILTLLPFFRSHIKFLHPLESP